jgi:hypothetical protein
VGSHQAVVQGAPHRHQHRLHLHSHPAHPSASQACSSRQRTPVGQQVVLLALCCSLEQEEEEEEGHTHTPVTGSLDLRAIHRPCMRLSPYHQAPAMGLMPGTLEGQGEGSMRGHLPHHNMELHLGPLLLGPCSH